MIGQTEIDAFNRDGVTVLRGIIGQDWLAQLESAIEENIANPGPYGKNHTEQGRPGAYFGDYVNWQRIRTFKDVCDKGPLGAVAGEDRRVVGKPLCRNRELRQRLLVLEKSPVVVVPPGQTRLGQPR